MTAPNYCLTMVVRRERGADEMTHVMRKVRSSDGRALGIAVVAVFLWAAALASAASPQRKEEPSPPQPAPLRKAINELRWTAIPPPEDVPTFRTSVTVHENLTPLWVIPPRTAAPRPRGSLYHEESLVLVTPGPSGKSAPTPAAQFSTDPGELLEGV